MGSSDKGGDAGKRYNYFGTVVGAVCLGPVDAITGILFDRLKIFDGVITRSGDTPADLSGSIPSKYLGPGGSLKFYWGTDAQPIDTTLEALGRPRYRGVAYLVGKSLLFGTEKTSAPNLQVIVRRKPVVDVSIVSATYNTQSEGQINPVAAIAELLTHPQFGAGLPVDRFDGASWEAAAAYAYGKRATAYCSPLITTTASLRDSVASLLAMFDGALAWTPSGTLAVRLMKPGVNPGGLTTIDAACLAEGSMVELSAPSWGDVPTSIAVKYFDHLREFKAADEVAHNPIANELRGSPSLKTVEMPHITRRDQCAAWAAELLRREMLPATSVKLSVRPERLGNLGPGDKVIVDIDPEPGGDSLNQLAVITDRRDAAGKATKLALVCDPLTASTPFSPTAPVDNPTSPDVPPIEHALVIPLPADEWPETSIAVLATRPTQAINGLSLYFGTDPGGVFATLGIQTGFACRLVPQGAASGDASEVTLHLIDGADGPDSYLAGLLPETETDATLNRVLLVFAEVDEDGVVTITDGEADLEFASVVTRVAVAPADHTYTILRGRLGTRPRAITTNTQVWLVPLSNVAAWTHPELDVLRVTQELGYVRLRSISNAEESADYLEVLLRVPPAANVAPEIDWIAPETSFDRLPDELYTVRFVATDLDGDLVRVTVESSTVSGTGRSMLDDISMEPTGEFVYGQRHWFFAGANLITVTLHDRKGHTYVSTRIFYRAYPDTIDLVSFYPADGEFVTAVDVELSTMPPGDRIQWGKTAIGAPAPSTGLTTVNSLATVVSLNGSFRLWARSGTGSGWSDWAFVDYRKIR